MQRYEKGHSMLRADSMGAIIGVLRGRGVRFVEATSIIAMGVVLMRDEQP